MKEDEGSERNGIWKRARGAGQGRAGMDRDGQSF